MCENTSDGSIPPIRCFSEKVFPGWQTSFSHPLLLARFPRWVVGWRECGKALEGGNRWSLIFLEHIDICSRAALCERAYLWAEHGGFGDALHWGLTCKSHIDMMPR